MGGGGSLMLIGLLVLRCKRWRRTKRAPSEQEGKHRKRRAVLGRARGMERAAGSEDVDDDMFELNDAARAAAAEDGQPGDVQEDPFESAGSLSKGNGPNRS